MRVLAQPARRSDRTVERHFQDTIVRPVVISDHADLLDPSTLNDLQRLFPSGAAQMWGVVPGKSGANLPEIRKMAPGDWVFFSGDKRLHLGGTVALTWRNPQLAQRLWGTDASGETWEYMYALAGARGFDIPIEEVRTLLGWNVKRNVMRFQAFTQDESEMLQQRYSLTPSLPPGDVAPILPGLHSDSASPADLLGNETDVDMLAKLAMAKITAPPLAVALLGEWGAGKSSFINQMSSRVDDLAAISTESSSESSAFATSVRQVHFNAWHYNDDHVWSGLVEQLFRVLAPEPEPDATVANPTAAERERRAADLARLETEQLQLDEELARTERNRPRGFLTFLGSPGEGVRLTYSAVCLGLRDVKHGWLYAVGWLVLIGVVLLAKSWLATWLTALLGFIVVIAAPVLPLWMVIRQWHSQGRSWTGKIRGSLEDRQRTLREEIVTSRALLAEIDAAVRLSGFLAQRSNTYQEQRGLLGTVHHDLFQLDEKLREAHAEWSSSKSTQPPPLERIILYIDDLDRCSPQRVVEVLAAVHLMLALPLFVVVVAVDPRWLLRSLEHHYSELFTDSAGTSHITAAEDTATPMDYLDKIFQIPFVVPPITPEKTARLITALLETSAVSEVPVRPNDTEAAPSSPNAGSGTAASVGTDEETLAEGPVQLQLQPQEITFMSRVGSLTQTPRAAKKLVNLYRLVRIGVPPAELLEFEGSSDAQGEHQVVQLLLALLVGSPHQAGCVFRALLAAPPNTKITNVLRGLPADAPVGDRVADLIERINAEVPVIMDVSTYQKWCPKLARFSFYTRNLAA